MDNIDVRVPGKCGAYTTPSTKRSARVWKLGLLSCVVHTVSWNETRGRAHAVLLHHDTAMSCWRMCTEQLCWLLRIPNSTLYETQPDNLKQGTLLS